jgi:hypothetical protein
LEKAESSFLEQPQKAGIAQAGRAKNLVHRLKQEGEKTVNLKM